MRSEAATKNKTPPMTIPAISSSPKDLSVSPVPVKIDKLNFTS